MPNRHQVMEVWRHASLDGMQDSRELARDDKEWIVCVDTMAKYADNFRTSIVRPAAFSNWQ